MTASSTDGAEKLSTERGEARFAFSPLFVSPQIPAALFHLIFRLAFSSFLSAAVFRHIRNEMIDERSTENSALFYARRTGREEKQNEGNNNQCTGNGI